MKKRCFTLSVRHFFIIVAVIGRLIGRFVTPGVQNNIFVIQVQFHIKVFFELIQTFFLLVIYIKNDELNFCC